MYSSCYTFEMLRKSSVCIFPNPSNRTTTTANTPSDRSVQRTVSPMLRAGCAVSHLRQIFWNINLNFIFWEVGFVTEYQFYFEVAVMDIWMIACHAFSFCSYRIDALAGLVDGRRWYCSNLDSALSCTSVWKYFSAIAPLKKTWVMPKWSEKNDSKSLAQADAVSISESRLVSRVHEASTSHTAMPADFTIWILDS